MNKFFQFLLLVLLQISINLQASSEDVMQSFSEKVHKYTLKNGLKVLFYPTNNAPVFSAQLWVKVGGVNEIPGKTGAAHLLEHMAFKGSETIGTKDYQAEKELLNKVEEIYQTNPEPLENPELKEIYQQLAGLWDDNEFSRLYQIKGAKGLNAGTAKDYTMYQVELPAVAFEFWCWMESDRILKPVFRQFYKERDVVQEERRMRTDDSPAGLLYEAMLATAYWNHPYRLPTVGWSDDVGNLMTSDTMQLHQKYYRPDNIVISLVGSLEPEKILPLLEKYFERLEKPTEPLAELKITEPQMKGPREVEVKFEAEPMMMLAYHKPVYPNPDDLSFSILHQLLSGGRNSVLYKELVLEKKLAVSIGSSEAPGELFPSVFFIYASPARGVSNRRLKEEIEKIFARLKQTGFPGQDFISAKKQVKTSFLAALEDNSEIAEMLAHAELLYGDWTVVNKMYQMIESAKVEDINALIGKYLIAEKSIFARLEKK